MRLIGLAGRKQSGKDSTFTIIRNLEEVTAVRRAFGDKLKQSAMAALGLHADGAEGLKKFGKIELTYTSADGEYDYKLGSISGREYLQRFGTEAHRNVFGPDFWVDQVLPKTGWQENFIAEELNGPYYPDFAIVTDVRFPSEAERVRELGGEIWHINSDKRLGDNIDEHVSEAKLPDYFIDRTLDNNATVVELEQQIKGILYE